MARYFLLAPSWCVLPEFWSIDAIFPCWAGAVWQKLFLGMAPRIQHPTPQNLWIICEVVLWYMAQLTLKGGDPGGSNLITWAFKRRELSAAGCRSKSQKVLKPEKELTCFCLKMEGATWEGVWAASKSKQQSQQRERDLHPPPARKWVLPTPDWAWKRVLHNTSR